MSTRAGMTNARNWMRSPERDLSFEVSNRMALTTMKNSAMAMTILRNLSPADMETPVARAVWPPGPDGCDELPARPGRRKAGRDAGQVRSAVDQDDGQDFSMLLRASSVLSPVIQAVISFQKEFAPTSPGIWSEPSKRKTASGSWKICADSWSIGLTRLATSRPVLALTQPPPGVALAFSLAHTSVDR